MKKQLIRKGKSVLLREDLRVFEYPDDGEIKIHDFKTIAEVKEFMKENKMEKELSTEQVEHIVDLKNILKRHEDSYNKNLTYVYSKMLEGIYHTLLIEGYSKGHLEEVVYSESFEYKGIKY